MLDRHSSLIGMLAHAYGLSAITLHPLNVLPTKQVYRVDSPHGPSWILRAHAVANHSEEQHVSTLTNLLTLLEAYAYPAERLLRTIENAAMASYQEWRYLMTTYIRGRRLPYQPATLRLLGAALGQLHAFAPHLSQANISIPLAGMRPAPELAYVLAQLYDIEHLVPTNRSARYETLLTAIHQIDPCNIYLAC